MTRSLFRYVDTAFRLRWLWLVAVVVWAGLGLAVVSAYRPEYEAVARLRVREPILGVIDPGVLPPEAAAAWYHTRIITNLIASDTFMLRVAQQTPLRDAVATPDGRQTILPRLTRGLEVIPIGRRLIEVRFVTDQPQVAPPLITALVGAVLSARQAIEQEQLTLTIDFYRVYLGQAEDAWLNAMAALRNGMLADPDLGTEAADPLAEPADPLAPAPTPAADPLREQRALESRMRADELAAREARASAQYVLWRRQMEVLQYSLAAQEASIARSLTVVDEPTATALPLSFWRSMSLRLIAVTVFVVSAVVGIVLMVTWADRTVRSRAEVGRFIGAPTLGSLPAVRQPWWRRRASVRRLLVARPS